MAGQAKEGRVGPVELRAFDDYINIISFQRCVTLHMFI